MSKYPPFERVGAGKLRVGDTILVRDGNQDMQVVDMGEYDREARDYVGRTYIEHGQHKVTYIRSELHKGHRRASRYYDVALANGQTVTCSAVQRWNRVTP